MSKRKAGPSGSPRPRTTPRAEKSRGSFVIRWKGTDTYLKMRRGVRHLVTKVDAQVFDSHDDAVKACKKYVRNGHFKVDWKDFCVIEPVTA